MYVKPKAIRWGWLWYFQILITEWIFFPLAISIIFVLINWTFIWFPLLVVNYLYIRKNSFNTSLSVSDFLSNIFPFKVLNQKRLKKVVLNKLTHFKTTVPHSEHLVIHVHGGAWIHGDALQLLKISDLFARYNMETISVNYCKFPEVHLDEIVSDFESTFLEILKTNQNRKIILYGRSAGAYLVLMIGLKYFKNINKIVALYPVTDLFELKNSTDTADILNTPIWIKQILGDDVDISENIKKLNPVDLVHENLPKTLLVHGENDPVVSVNQSNTFYKICQSKNLNQVEYLKFNYATHGFDGIWNGLSMRVFKKRMINFIFND